MVQKVRINSSNELYDNANDNARVYTIQTNVNIIGGKMDSTDNGIVYKEDDIVANFNSWGGNNLNITYQGVSVTERNEINIAVDAFINDVKESVKQ